MMFLIAGVLSILFVVWIVMSLYRIGKPVNSTLSDSYYHHAWKNKIVYSPMGNWFELGYYETEADPTTFQALARDYGKDHQSVFLRGRKQQVDRATFFLDEDRIPKDKQHVYFEKEYTDSLHIIIDADPATYHPYKLTTDTYDQQWYRDANAFYLNGKKIDVDSKTFQRINKTLAIDGYYVYVILYDEPAQKENKQVIKKASRPEGQIQSISENYARIGNTVLLSNWKSSFSLLVFETIDSVVLLTERQLSVNGKLVSDGVLIEGFDAYTFQEVSRDHFKDKDYVYYEGKKIEGADASTFELIREEYAKDTQRVYYKNQTLLGANASTIKTTYEFNKLIATDGHLKFKDGVLVKD
jgi:DKNYY family